VKIVGCSISEQPKTILDPLPEVRVKLEDGTHHTLFTYYPDEISFESHEFIGLTIADANMLKMTKDKEFLQS
jgi:hypothetical protein